MMNRRHFLGAAGVAVAGSVVAGPALWSKRRKSSVFVILTGGIWHANTAASEGWKMHSSGSQVFRRPDFSGRKLRARYGLNWGKQGSALATQLTRLRSEYFENQSIEIISNGQSYMWESGSDLSFPMPSHGVSGDAASLAFALSPTDHPQVMLLHGTDVAHFNLGRYLEVEALLANSLPKLADQLKEQGRSLSVICLQGRDAKPNALGGLDHATEESAAGGWWIELI